MMRRAAPQRCSYLSFAGTNRLLLQRKVTCRTPPFHFFGNPARKRIVLRTGENANSADVTEQVGSDVNIPESLFLSTAAKQASSVGRRLISSYSKRAGNHGGGKRQRLEMPGRYVRSWLGIRAVREVLSAFK